MCYIIGIDQGGTKTCAAVMDTEGSLLGVGRTGGCYFPADGIDFAMRLIVDSVEKAIRDANIQIDDIDMIVSGVTGIDWEGDDLIISDTLARHFGNKDIFACNDCEIAYYGGSINPVGAVICAGTGINAAFFAPSGKIFVMGDYLKSSLQGGSALARRAIEAVFDSDLGVLPCTRLTDLFLNFSGDGNVYELLHRCITSEDFRGKIISLVPQIIATAEGGDTVARGVITSFAEELCEAVIAAMKMMDMLELDCNIVLTGGIFKGSTNCLRAAVVKILSQSAKNASFVGAEYEPVVGACILGNLKKTGCINKAMTHNISVTAEKLGLLRK